MSVPPTHRGPKSSHTSKRTRNRLLLATAVAAATALALTACGTTQPSSSASTAKAAPISLTDTTGTTVKLDGPATKVVGTEWNVVEDLVTLGVKPVGVADVKGYGEWDSGVPLTNKPKDIGTRGEPSLDSIAALTPDLIVATTDLPAATLKQMRQIAPVLVIRPANGADQIGEMFTGLDLIAKATGTTEKAATVKKGFDAKLASAKKELDKAGKAGTQVAFADSYVDSNQVSIRPYTKTSLIGSINAKLGLENAWTVAGDKDYGLATTDVEGLTKLGDVDFLYVANSKDGGDTFQTALASNAIWKNLSFVKSDKVHRLSDGIWVFGGPASMENYISALVTTLTK